MKIVIIGTGGLAREICTWFGEVVTITGFSTLHESEFYQYKLPGKCFNDDITPETVGTNRAILGIGSPELKEKLYNYYKNRGFSFPTLIHSTALVPKNTLLDMGCVISPRAILGPGCEIGKCVYVNYSAIIGHDASIGDFCQVNPLAYLSGLVKIGKKCIIGASSSILQGVSVTDNVVIGIGSVIMSNVRHSGTMFGNPAKRFKIRH